MLRTLLTVAFVTMIAAVSGARPSEYEPRFHEVSMEVTTPHVQWAKPYHGGTVRGLFIAPRPCHRDTVELAQRLDIEYDVVGTYLRDQLAGGTDRVTRIVGFSPEDVKQRLLRKLEMRYDVIVVGNVLWKLLPQEVEYEILRKVRGGTGLVLTYSEQGRTGHLERALAAGDAADSHGFITNGIPYSGLLRWQSVGGAEAAAQKLVELHQFGAGRIAVLKLAAGSTQTYLVPPTSTDEFWKQQYPFELEYYLSLAAKAILWAAGNEPNVYIEAMSIGDTERVLRLPEDRAPRLEVGLNGLRPHDSIAAEVTVRDATGTVLVTERRQFDVPRGATDIQVPLPADCLPAGRHFAEIILRSKGGACINWGATAFTVQRPTAIAELTSDREYVEPGETLNLKATLDGPAPQNSRIHWQIHDSLGRLVYEAEESIAEGETAAAVRYIVDNPVCNLLIARARLLVDKCNWSAKAAPVPVDLPAFGDDFGFLVWSSGSTEYAWRYGREVLYDLGVDTAYRGGALQTAVENLRVLPARRAGLHPNEATVEHLVRKPCLSDPAHRQRVKQRLLEAAEGSVGFGATGYTLGDDNRLGSTDICFSDHCLSELRGYLQWNYVSLEDLNQQWGTEFENWQEVTPTTLSDARENDQPSRWIDHRMHMETVYADFHDFARHTITSVEPSARVGSDAAIGRGSFGGYDWWKYSRAVTLWNVYPHLLRVECLRSLKQPGTYCGLWYGGYNHIWRFEEGVRWVPWHSLLHDLDSAWWFKIYSSARERCQEDGIAADLRPFPILAASADTIKEIKGGIGKLLLGAERDNLGIAVLYSQPSLHAATFEGRPGAHQNAVSGCLNLLEDLGLQYDIVPYAGVRDDLLAKGEYQLLILPHVTALSETARDGIESFVRGGGRLTADIRPGVTDGHGKPVRDNNWENLFGIARKAEDAQLAKASAAISGSFRGVAIAGRLGEVTIDTAVSATDALVLGHTGRDATPVCLLNGPGRGVAILTNFSFADYEAKSDDGQAMRAIIAGLIRAATDVRQDVRVQTQTDEGILEGEVVTYTDGALRYVAVLRHHTPEHEVQTARLELPTGYHVYNMRTGEYLGSGEPIAAQIGDGDVALLSLLPYRVDGLDVTLRPQECEPGDLIRGHVSLAMDGDVPGRHVVHIAVSDPDGRELRHYAQNVEAVDGSGGFEIPLALDDAAGKWRVSVRDVATGKAAEVGFVVAGRAH